MKKLFIPIILILVAVLFGGYAYMGGFSNATVTETTTSEMYIAGKYYEGSLKNEAFGELFKKAASLVESGELSGDMGGIYYNNPDKEEEIIKAFIGVVVADTVVKLPSDYEIRKIEAGQDVVQGEIEAHYLLAPNKLYPAIFKYAKEKDMQLKPLYIERFMGTKHAIVQAVIEK